MLVLRNAGAHATLGQRLRAIYSYVAKNRPAGHRAHAALIIVPGSCPLSYFACHGMALQGLHVYSSLKISIPKSLTALAQALETASGFRHRHMLLGLSAQVRCAKLMTHAHTLFGIAGDVMRFFFMVAPGRIHTHGDVKPSECSVFDDAAPYTRTPPCAYFFLVTHTDATLRGVVINTHTHKNFSLGMCSLVRVVTYTCVHACNCERPVGRTRPLPLSQSPSEHMPTSTKRYRAQQRLAFCMWESKVNNELAHVGHLPLLKACTWVYALAR